MTVLSSWLKGDSHKAESSGFIWNAVSGFLNAFQSTIILFFIQRLADEAVSGVFSIAYALAGLMSIIGKFNVRYFQVSDVKNQFSYNDYYSHRILTSLLMLIVSLGYCFVQAGLGTYSYYKFFVCFFFCCLRSIDCIEDVFGGNLQKQGRLDIGGKAMFIRSLLTTAVFVIVFAVCRELLTAILVSTAISLIVFVISMRSISSDFPLPAFSKSFSEVKKVFIHCLPLFVSAFLLQFVITSPKLVIDAVLSSEMQATYGFISMPIFLVALIAEFLFRPLTIKFADDWSNKRLSLFVKRMFSVIGIIICITVVFVLGGYFLGIPLLEIFFNTSLAAYKLPLVILLFGSGVLSLTSYLGMMLTIMRRQKLIVYSYIPSSIFAIPIGYYLVKNREIMGAALSYMILLSLMLVFLLIIVFSSIYKEKNN